MKRKFFLLLLLVAAGVGTVWYLKSHSPAPSVTTAQPGRKILYYQSAMHPWIKSDQPGKCPICGMDLVPVYAGETSSSPAAATSGERKIKLYQSSMKPGETSPTPAKDSMGMDMAPIFENDATAINDTNIVTLTADNVTIVNVQTEIVKRRPITRSIHVIGRIQKNSATAAWFVFDVYERDLPWIRIGQTLEVTLPAVPDKIYSAEIKLHGTEPFADRTLDEMSDSTKIRAKISDAPVEVPGFEGKAFFNNLHAEAHIVGTTLDVLAVPRSAIISPGSGPLAFVDRGGGHYESRALKLGRIGDDYAEVLEGLDAGDKVVTHGGLLIDAEAHLSAGR